MNNDWKDGSLRVIGTVICLINSGGIYEQALYNYENGCSNPNYRVCMPDDYYVPAMIDRPVRYLIHNDQIIIAKV